MVKIISVLLLVIFITTKSYSASNNLFFTTAQLMTYCKSENLYEQGICDGYIIAINDVIYSLKKENLLFNVLNVTIELTKLYVTQTKCRHRKYTIQTS